VNERLALVGIAAGAALAGLLVGRLQGIPAPVATTAPSPAEAAAVRDYSPEELQIACLPYMRRTATSLEEAQTRVNALELRIRDKETLIEVLEERTVAGGARATSDLQAARDQLAALETELAEAIDEKARMLVTLARAQDELQDSRLALAASEARAIEAREATIDQQWMGFVQEAQLRICHSGNPDRLAQCRDLVVDVITPLRARFKECVRSGAALPELRQATRPEDRPPGISASLDVERDPLTRGWYVALCDPSLPEAGSSRP
jgi:hypothetical protein